MAANTQIWSGAAADNDHSAAGNWDVAEAPETGDTLIFPAMAAATGVHVAGSDESAILQAATFIENGCYVEFGSRIAYLQLDTDALTFAGDGQAYFDIDNCALIRIENAAYAGSGHTYGFNLVGTGNTALVCDPGSGKAVGLAALGDESLACTTITIDSGNVDMGSGLTTTTLNVTGGAVNNSSAISVTNIGGGTLRQVAAKVTTLNIKKGGRVYYNGTAPTTINLYAGGILDLSERTAAMAVDAMNVYGGQVIDPHNVLAVTTLLYKVGLTASYS